MSLQCCSLAGSVREKAGSLNVKTNGFANYWIGCLEYEGRYGVSKAEIINQDCIEGLRSLETCFVQSCITSPPYYGLRDYGNGLQIGQEKSPEEFVEKLVTVFKEVKRVLKDDGTLWLNLGDSYAGGMSRGMSDFADKQASNAGSVFAKGKGAKVPPGLKAKDLIGIPWRVAFALQKDGWFLRQDIIWSKPNPMPESVKDRCTKAHEYIFLLSKSKEYYFDINSIKEDAVCGDNGSIFYSQYDLLTKPGVSTKPRKSEKRGAFNGKTGSNAFRAVTEKRHKRSVWTVATAPFKGAHFATFPEKLITPCVLAGSKKGDLILDPFAGACTTGLVALKNGRKFIGFELNSEYVELGKRRIMPMAYETIGESITASSEGGRGNEDDTASKN